MISERNINISLLIQTELFPHRSQVEQFYNAKSYLSIKIYACYAHLDSQPVPFNIYYILSIVNIPIWERKEWEL